MRKFIDIVTENEGVERWLAAERERTSRIPIYHEKLKQKEARFFAKVVAACREICPELEKVCLYGSRADNTAKRSSDWDILVVIPAEMEHDRFMEMVGQSGERPFAGRTIDIQFDKEQLDSPVYRGNMEHALIIS